MYGGVSFAVRNRLYVLVVSSERFLSVEAVSVESVR